MEETLKIGHLRQWSGVEANEIKQSEPTNEQCEQQNRTLISWTRID